MIASGPDGNDTLVDDFVLLKDGQGNVDENYGTDFWQVSPYHCGVELYVGLYSNWTDDGAWPIESFDESFDAPCEDPPETDLTAVWLQQLNWGWCEAVSYTHLTLPTIRSV